jgi:hypothetical protein
LHERNQTNGSIINPGAALVKMPVEFAAMVLKVGVGHAADVLKDFG